MQRRDAVRLRVRRLRKRPNLQPKLSGQVAITRTTKMRLLQVMETVRMRAREAEQVGLEMERIILVAIMEATMATTGTAAARRARPRKRRRAPGR